MTGTVLIYAIHRMEGWWRHIGDHMGFDHAVVLTDRRGKGDRWVTDDFYAAYENFRTNSGARDALLAPAEITDIIARCRVLRWLPTDQATAMAQAMATAMERVLDTVRPTVVTGFPIDSYVSDVLARRARARGIPYFEVTASALPGMCMLMHRGRLINSDVEADAGAVETRIREIAAPVFTPTYVQNQAPFTRARFLRTFWRFRLRGWVFKAVSWLKRDPLNLHYLDAQSSLGHKPQLSDIRVIDMVQADWKARVQTFPRDRRVLFGLQLLPEAAIDYWVDDLAMVRHEDMLVEAARHLVVDGFIVVVKDHPLQFGFRQTELLSRLSALPNVVIAPYEVSGNEMLATCGVSLTATGTLGLQAALLGLKSVTAEAYYVPNEQDFIVLKTWHGLSVLPHRLHETMLPADLYGRQARIVARLLQGSFDADFFCFQGFDDRSPDETTAELGRQLGARLRLLGPDGENWHGRHMPRGGGGHDGSPLR
ncbi:MAG: hypothetical protein JHC81_05190 [Brevundimonas sp.]|uniref:hypothetical protein n=1 Tax=Brevundimonas sp. TaxID=1871086 RepID=UPI001A1E80F7|nr:hypothetical protein [Brevundimonas sp.]MBJ7446910.1 hypothetical protein [Brevundimonas sp.]